MTRRALSSKVVLFWLFFGLCAALGLAVWIWGRFVRFEPVAERHLPPDVAVAVRIDVEQVVVYQPFREAFLPLFEADRKLPGSRMEHLENETSIEILVDLREAVLAQDKSGHWVLALGGHFRQDGLLDGLERLLATEGVQVRREQDPEHLVFSTGAAFAGASDGTLVLASSSDTLRRALPSKSPAVRFTPGVALSFVVSEDGEGEGSVSSEGGEAGEGVLRSARVDVRNGTPFPFEAHLVSGSAGLDVARARSLLAGETGDFPLLGRLSAPIDVRIEGAEVSARGTVTRPEMALIVGRLAERFGQLSRP